MTAKMEIFITLSIQSGVLHVKEEKKQANRSNTSDE